VSYTVEVAPNGATVKRSTCAECGGAVTFEPFLCAWLHDAAELAVEHDGVVKLPPGTIVRSSGDDEDVAVGVTTWAEWSELNEDGVGDEEMTAIESHLSAGERYLGGGGAACEWWIEVAETTKVVDHG
jgi:hypothetical protein